MTSFKRWFGAGAIVLVALALIACPAMLPTVADEIGDMKFGAGDIGEARTVPSLGDYFNARDNATYDASSSDVKVATASVAGTTLTVTAKGPGTATVTVTAKDRDGEVTQRFSVTVAEPPDPPVNNPPVSKTIPDESLQVGDTKMLALSKYYTDSDGDALTYTAASSDDAIATVTGPNAGSMITITAVAAGTATITVSANDGTNAAVAQTFDVTVTAPVVVPNDPPVSKTIPDVPSLQMGKTKMLALSKYYTDSDGDALTYTAASGNEAVATVTDPDDATSMITITAVAAGTATITVSAKDTKNAAVEQTFEVTVTATPPVVRPNERPTSEPIDDVPLRVGDTTMVTLSDSYRDQDGDELMYTADSSNDAIATVTDPDAGSMITITAVGVGKTMIKVTATDGNSDPVPETFMVTVQEKLNAAPKPTTGIGTAVPLTVGDDPKTLDLKNYFMDPEGDSLTYKADSSDAAIATVTDPDDATSMITITAVAAGTATITVTASDKMSNNIDGEDVMNMAAEVVFNVTVSATPPEPNNPPTLVLGKTPPPVSLVTDDTPSTALDVSEYFMDADGDTLTYTADPANRAVATASVTGSMVTITAVGAGTTNIVVTASDGEASSMLTISVTVSSPTNMAPRMKAGMMLRDLAIVVKGTGQDSDKGADADDNELIDLSKYFEDPDGVLLVYKVEKTETPADPAGTPVIDLHSSPADGTTGAAGTAPDGTDPSDTTVVIEPRNAGKATVIVTVTDVGKKSTDFEFMVTVVTKEMNTGPIALAITPPKLTGTFEKGENARMLKIDETRTVIDDAKIGVYFKDNDFIDGDMLTFSVKYFPMGTTKTAAANRKTEALADDKVGVIHSPLPDPWNGATGTKFTLSLTGVKGNAEHVVALIATDKYRQSAAQVFPVRVNHDPKAEGAQATPLKLSGETGHMDLGYSTVKPVANDMKIALVAVDAGYFSDGDSDIKSCRIDAFTGTASSKFSVSTTELTIMPRGFGDASVTVSCVDSFDRRSGSDTLRVKVTHVAGTNSQR